MGKKKKWYVVWEGKKPGVYDNWKDCEAQVKGLKGTKYKSFGSKEAAEKAYGEHFSEHYGKKDFEPSLSAEELKKIGDPIRISISVDGAGDNQKGTVEYRGVFTETETEVFRAGPFSDGTNNLAEFLALVHALAWCKKNKIDYPIYSDSRTAMSWVRRKECRSKKPRTSKNREIYDLVDRAIAWLKNNRYQNQILKWETKAWGEIPADYGRK